MQPHKDYGVEAQAFSWNIHSNLNEARSSQIWQYVPFCPGIPVFHFHVEVINISIYPSTYSCMVSITTWIKRGKATWLHSHNSPRKIWINDFVNRVLTQISILFGLASGLPSNFRWFTSSQPQLSLYSRSTVVYFASFCKILQNPYKKYVLENPF